MAIRAAERLKADASVDVMFEPLFRADDFVARADILIRVDDDWQLLEVKSSVNDKPELVEDLAYTAMVLRRSGLKIDKASLLLLARDYRFGDPVSDQFVRVDHTADVEELLTSFEAEAESVVRATSAAHAPAEKLINACKNCEFLECCFESEIQELVIRLPRMSAKKLQELRARDIRLIADIPTEYKLTVNQERVRMAAATGQPWVEVALSGALDDIRWPAYYLDFETVMTPLPVYAGVAPYEQIPTQYSVHICDTVGNDTGHAEYLASDPQADCRRELTERLIEDLGDEGSIAIYTSFEVRIIKALAALFPDLADRFTQCLARIVDLHAIIKDHYYHPNFHGSTSIKSTLPALVGDLAYDDLEISDGGAASAIFDQMARGRYSAVECEQIRSNLMEYCKRDTMAMVRLHEVLVQIADNK